MKYYCKNGECHGSVFSSTETYPLLYHLNMYCDMPCGQRNDVYFITGEFYHGYILCLPITQEDEWLLCAGVD